MTKPLCPPPSIQTTAFGEKTRAATAAARPGVTEREIVAVRGVQGEAGGVVHPQHVRDLVIVEEPLQICVCGEPWITTMRTPGRDHALVLGLLWSEGLITSAADVSALTHCGRPGTPGYGNVMDVSPGAGFAFDAELLEASRRLAHAGCGVCGRRDAGVLLKRSRQAEGALARAPLRLNLVFEACDALHARQKDFVVTGGCHAAAALDRGGRVLAHAEDVGRHNALDKVLGGLLLKASEGCQAPLQCALLAVSGRAGFELTQKAIVAGAQVLCSISAPSSEAVDLARDAGLCLAGFVRRGRCNIYSHPEQLCAVGAFG